MAYLNKEQTIEAIRKYADIKHSNGEQIEYVNGILKSISVINEQPPADAEEVKHGYWYNIDSDVGWELVGCSVCRKEYSLCEGEDKTDYCPYCGAKMDGGNQ